MTDQDRTPRGETTRLVHTGEHAGEYAGAVVTPVFRSAMYEETEQVDDQVVYIRYHNTPNHRAVAAKLASIEGTEAAVVLGSGMAAISASVLAVLGHGDRLLAQRTLYGGTHALFTRDLPAMGIEVDFVEGDEVGVWEAARRPGTKAIYVEAITNPSLHVPALDRIAAWARDAGLVSMIDATMVTPLGRRPEARGFDLTIHSATKYLNGHSDIVAGAVAGSARLCRAVLEKAQRLGGSLDPDACALLSRGMKTLALRYERQCTTAARLAKWLDGDPRIGRVVYPGLPSHPSYANAERLLVRPGALFAFEVDGAERARGLQERLRLFAAAPSFGGVESLITRPAHTSHKSLGPQARAERGIGDGLLRIAVGIEDFEDLRADLEQALEIL